MALLDSVKTSLRVDGTDFDDEIGDLIAACKADLVMAGCDAEKLLDSDKLYGIAVRLYCRGIHDGDEKSTQLYNGMKNAMAISEEYRATAEE